MSADCPRCNGDGFNAGAVKPGPSGTMRPTKEMCRHCDGKGTVDYDPHATGGLRR